MNIAIIGAGISGLAAARFLNELGHDLRIFESAPNPRAGLLESRRIDGYTFDACGGHIIYSRDAWASEFFHSLYVDEPLLTHTRNSKVFFRDRLVKYPFENGLSELPREVNFDCLMGYIKAWVRRRNAEEADKIPSELPGNFREWIDYRLGEGIARHFMVPYNEKVWNCDLVDMCIDWIAGRIPEAPLEDVVRSSLGIPTEGYKHQSTFYYPLRGGIQDLAMRIGAPVKDMVVYDHRVALIRKKGDEAYEVDGEEFDAVIYTAPLDCAPSIIEGLDNECARAASALQHISLTTFFFGIDGADAKPLSWVYLPSHEEGPVNRLTYLSNYSPNHAPEGKASILAEITHRGPLEVDSKMIGDVRDHLCDLGFMHRDRIHVEAQGHAEHAYILFDRDFKEKQRLAQEGMHKLGIHTLGRFGQYDYLNMDHCVIRAKALAEEISEERK